MKRIVFALALLITSWSFASLTDGLVGYWPFNGNVKDGSGRGHKLSGSVAYTADLNGNDNSAAVFEGNASLKLPQSLYVARSLTVSVWCKPSGTIPTGLRDMLSQTDGSTMVGSQYVLYPSHGGLASTGKAGVGLVVGQNGVIVMEHADEYCPTPLVWYGNIGNNWTLVTVTIFGNGAPHLYINGDFIKKGMASSKTKFVGAADRSLSDVYLEENQGYYWGSVIGNGVTVDYSHCPYYGLMDDFRIYNRALSASEIKLLYEGEVVQLHAVKFDANNGEEIMEDEMVMAGADLSLPPNKFHNDGFVFQGWALSSSGEVVYKDEALITVNSDMTLYAVWASPSLTLAAESADWSSGSITLRCTDVDTSGRTHTYTLQYYDESTDTWKDVSSVQSASASVSLPDTDFSSRLGGIPPVKYRVKDENGRVSAECVTRTKYGIFVAPGSYASNMVDGEGRAITPLPLMVDYANKFETLALGLGQMANIHTLTGANAKYDILDDKFKKVESTIKPGDICFLYFGTHGGVEINKTNPSLVLYDHFYTEQELARHVQTLNKVSEHNPKGTGVAVVGFVHACHSGGIAINGDGDGYCVPNAWCVNSALLSDSSAWVTATDDSKTIAVGSYFSEFLLAYGWESGWAGDSSGGILSCKALADYTKERVDALFDGIKMKNGYGQEIEVRTGISDKHHILRHIMMGHRGSHDGNRPVPTSPVIAVEGRSGVIEITCDNVYNADTVVKFKKRGEGAYYEIWDGGLGSIRNGERSTISDLDVAGSGGDCPYFYQIRIYNGAGVGKSNEDSAWRIHDETLTVRFTYDVPNANYGGWQWSSAYGRSLTESGIWNAIGEKIDALDKRGYTLVGWFTERGGKGTKITQGTIVYSDKTYYGYWTPMTKTWLADHPKVAAASSGDIATAAAMTAANGCRTVGECYALGINPEDPDDDFRIKSFKMDGTKPVVTVNHTEDGSGASLLPRMKILGKAELSGEWEEVPEEGNPAHRFFTVTVEEP